MPTTTERHLAEAREALAHHDRQRAILEVEVAALQRVIDLHPPEEDGRHSYREPGQPRPGSKRDRMETGVARFLRESGVPMHRNQIADYLRAEGIIGTEVNPLANVSNLLSSSDRFKAVGNNGLWALAE